MVFGATNSFNPNSGYDLISRLLAIVILGGLGSIGGALAAAVFLLVLQDVVASCGRLSGRRSCSSPHWWSCCRSDRRACSASAVRAQ